jgi:preprotein translocase subunit YajC
MKIDEFFALAALFAQVAPNPEEAPPWWVSLLPFVALFGFVYFILIRPQQQMKKQQDDLVASAKSGDRVVTTSGILGVIANVKDKTFIVRVSENTKVEFMKSAIAQIIKADGAEAKEPKDGDKSANESSTESSNGGSPAADERQEAPSNRSKKRKGVR